MEIADIFVVNKADREGADRTVASIEAMLALHPFAPGEWRPPIVKTEATTGKGVDELLDGDRRGSGRTPSAIGAARRRRARRVPAARAAVAPVRAARRAVACWQPGEFDALLDRIARARARSLHARPMRSCARARTRSAVTVQAQPRRSITSASRSPTSTQALAFYRDALGLTVERAGGGGVAAGARALHPRRADAALELLEATADDSPIAKYLAKRGPGLHHITLRVDDIAAALARLKARGVRLIDEEPRPGAHGSLVAFIHPAERTRRAGRAQAER